MTIQSGDFFNLNGTMSGNSVFFPRVPRPFIFADRLRRDVQCASETGAVSRYSYCDTNGILRVHGDKYRTIGSKIASAVRTEKSAVVSHDANMDKKQLFSNRLNSALDAIGYPAKGSGRQVQLAKDLDVSQKGARKWLEGEAIAAMEHAIELAVLCHVYTEWLLSGRGPREIDTPQPPPKIRDPEIEQWADHMECIPKGDQQKIFQVIKVLVPDKFV